MSKVRTRAFSLILLVVIAMLGMGFYVVRYIVSGAQWASAPFNATVFHGGTLAIGTVTDRNGVILASSENGRRTFNESKTIRLATLHAVGDREGNIGTGALKAFASDLIGYNLITGSYSLTSAGREISITIDSRLNTVAFNALGGQRGAVMVSNYETGEVLAMVSSPTFDPANPPQLFDNEEGVFVNRAIQSAFTPGSTFKMVTAAAAIDTIGGRVYDITFECTGSLAFGPDTLRCHGVHGTIGIERGMQVSCNIVYGELAIMLGPDVMAEYTKKFGLSGRTTVGGIVTANGNFDKAPEGSVNLAWSGVGQFNNTVCPASMIRFVGAIANGGNAVELQLINRAGISSIIPARTERIMSRSLADQLGFIIEIENRQNYPGLEIYAKTGTAEVGGGREPHAWFVGYITNPDYPLAFVVIVENGGGGAAVAAPIANQVLQAAVSR